MELHPGLIRGFELVRRNTPVGANGIDMEEVYRRVVACLDRVGSRWALVGAHAINLYVRPRVTDDIDLVIEAPQLKPILEALHDEFGDLRKEDLGAAVRVIDLSVDLIRGDQHVLFQAALDEAEERGGTRVPPAELMVALTFLAATSPWRQVPDRQQDAGDLVAVYQALREGLDREAALRHARTIYSGAETDLGKILHQIDRDDEGGA